MPTVYGIKSCDACRKAVKSLEGAGRSVAFHDVRDVPLERARIEGLLETFGDALINRRSTTWRSLSASERDGDPVELLMRHPTLMKRPVIEAGDVVTLGWDKASQATHLG